MWDLLTIFLGEFCQVHAHTVLILRQIVQEFPDLHYKMNSRISTSGVVRIGGKSDRVQHKTHGGDPWIGRGSGCCIVLSTMPY